MKTLIIGDIHGKNKWKEVVNSDNFDRIIFLGDYCDAYDYSAHRILTNLEDIIEYKKQNLDKVTLLYGNHDLQYLYLQDTNIKCSGFSKTHSTDFQNILSTPDIFTLATSLETEDNYYLFTHAGIIPNWLFEFKNVLSDYKKVTDVKGANILNMFLGKHYRNNLWDVSKHRYGASLHGSFVWADIREFNTENLDMSDFYDLLDIPLHKEVIQIAGHNRVQYPTEIDNKIYFLDCQDSNYIFGVIQDEDSTIKEFKLLYFE